MKGLRRAAVIAAAIVVASAALALSPAVHGQVRAAYAPGVLDVVLGGSRIGISIQDIEAAEAAKREVTGGVVVEEVTPESPAEQAGIRTGDLIVEFDGERVRSARQFTRLVQETPAGRSVPAVVLRDGQRTPLSVTPREADRARIEALEDLGGVMEGLRSRVITRPPARPAPPPPPPAPPPAGWNVDELLGRPSRIGITLGSLSPQLAEYFGATEGVLVTSVADGSVAQKAGVRTADVITAVNEASVRTPAEVRRRIQELKEGEEFTLSVVRDRKPLTIKGTVERTAPRRSVRTAV